MNRKKALRCEYCGSPRKVTDTEKGRLCLVCLSAKPVELPKDTSWVSLATCRTVNVDFYSDEKEDVIMAKIVCSDCVVRDKCLEEALRRKEGFGIWGGLTPMERAMIPKRRKSN